MECEPIIIRNVDRGAELAKKLLDFTEIRIRSDVLPELHIPGAQSAPRAPRIHAGAVRGSERRSKYREKGPRQ